MKTVKVKSTGGLGDTLRIFYLARQEHPDSFIRMGWPRKRAGSNTQEFECLYDYLKFDHCQYPQKPSGTLETIPNIKKEEFEPVDGLPERFVYLNLNFSHREKGHEMYTEERKHIESEKLAWNRYFTVLEEEKITKRLESLGYHVVKDKGYSIKQNCWLMQNSLSNIIVDSLFSIMILSFDEDVKSKTKILYTLKKDQSEKTMAFTSSLYEKFGVKTIYETTPEKQEIYEI